MELLKWIQRVPLPDEAAMAAAVRGRHSLPNLPDLWVDWKICLFNWQALPERYIIL